MQRQKSRGNTQREKDIVVWHLVIADGHPIVLRGLLNLLGSAGDFNVVATCSSGTECIRAIRQLRPQLALVDMAMPGLDGVEILGLVTSEQLPTRIVLLCASAEEYDLRHAAVRGAQGILFKNSTPDLLRQGLREVAFGRKWLPHTFVSGALGPQREQQNHAAAVPNLTDREQAVMLLASEGQSNKQIARHLGVVEGTIKMHLHNVYQKTAISNRTGLAALAISYRQTS